jgi:transcriptional regulator with XRE-family HTH domain
MEAAALIREARRRAGWSKRRLARAAGTSPAAIVLYESGRREPTLPTLQRILAAAGQHADVALRRARGGPDPATAGRRLAEVLALADRLPQRPAARRMAFPGLSP